MDKKKSNLQYCSVKILCSLIKSPAFKSLTLKKKRVFASEYTLSNKSKKKKDLQISK